MDYEKLLRAYIVHVHTCEGITFLDSAPGCETAVDRLSFDEQKELDRIADDALEQEERYWDEKVE